ncbi:biotin--[acetyl-CoA-carboxylase] ligase [Ignatzschineria sp. LJL83]
MKEDMDIIETIFQNVSAKKEYSLDILKSMLGIEEAILRDNLDQLCLISDLFKVENEKFSTLKEYIPLNSQEILGFLPKDLQSQLLIENRFMTQSTNLDLEKIQVAGNEECTHPLAAIAIAEMQRSGKGRRAKAWVSPLAKNLYFSFKYHFSQSSLEYLSTLSLRTGIVLLQILHDSGIQDAKIKWPNDIWVNGHKLAGILVESTFSSKGMDVVIGIGINNQIDQEIQVLENHPTSCEAVLGYALDRNLLVAKLTTKLFQLCEQIEKDSKNLLHLPSIWKEYSYFYGKTVQLISDHGIEIGQEMGVDESGALLIQYADGSFKTHLSGDLSVRAYE